MAAVSDRPSKRMRRRVTAELPDFFTFPAAGDAVPGGPFRSTVDCFLQKYGRLIFPPSPFSWLTMWQILFRPGDLEDGGDGVSATVALDIVEEDVTRSRSVYCDQCRVVGWSGHPVCRKRYHFIIRREISCNDKIQGQTVQGEGSGNYHKACCLRCGNALYLSDSRCKSCNFEFTKDDVEDWVNLQLEDSSHLLHGVIHSNGYGHILTLNGREGGSTILSGRDIMNFWDRLCKTLAARKISVMDVSKKYGMEYRLLHAITNGCSWYGDWGYEFGTGSYGLTIDAYEKAVEVLALLPLSLFNFQGRRPRTRMQSLISFYQSLSDLRLASLRDLLSFILGLVHGSHKSTKKGQQKKQKCTSNVLCAWTKNEVEGVEQAIIKVLQATGDNTNWFSRRALKGALCKGTSPELLDYCLKHLGGKVASNGMVVNTRCNPSSCTVEFRLEPCGTVQNQAGLNLDSYPSNEHLISDLKILYDFILHPHTMPSNISQANREVVIDSVTKLLDCKQFVKDYKPDKMAGTKQSAINLWCHVELAEHHRDDLAPAPAPILPPELLILPRNASIADLKLEASKAFQEVYVMFKRFEAEELLDHGPLDDSMTLKLLVGSSGSLRVKGRFLGTHGLSRFRMERGTEIWTVDCTCGTTDDDGERMLACDTCGIWQHTRCAGIDDQYAIPAKFVCNRCLNSYTELPKVSTKTDEAANIALPYLETDEADTMAIPSMETDEAAMLAVLSGTTCGEAARMGSNLIRNFRVPLM